VDEEKRTCGNCWWWKWDGEKTDPPPWKGSRWGMCRCPVPACVDDAEQDNAMAEDMGQSCPCWKAKP
jgi:hypothetical protein